MRVALFWGLGILVGLIAVGTAGVLFLTETEAGLRYAERQLERFVSDQIPGAMEIGNLEAIDFAATEATDVVFSAPDGSPVINVEHTRIEWDLRKLLSGSIAFRRASTRGGFVEIQMRPSGRLTIQDVFASEEPQDQSGEPTELDLENMHVEDMAVRLSFTGPVEFVVNEVEGFVRVWRHDTPGTRVRLDRVEGVFDEPFILDDRIELNDLSGQVWAEQEHVLSMGFKLGVRSGHVNVDLDYFDREATPVEIRLNPEPGGGTLLSVATTKIRGWLSDEVGITVE